MEENHKYIGKLSQFLTNVNSRKNCSIDLIPEKAKIIDFLSILYNRPLREYKKPKFKVGDRVRITEYDLPFGKSYKLQFTQEVYENVAISSSEPPT